jgi:hypothetical protein
MVGLSGQRFDKMEGDPQSWQKPVRQNDGQVKPNSPNRREVDTEPVQSLPRIQRRLAMRTRSKLLSAAAALALLALSGCVAYPAEPYGYGGGYGGGYYAAPPVVVAPAPYYYGGWGYGGGGGWGHGHGHGGGWGHGR